MRGRGLCLSSATVAVLLLPPSPRGWGNVYWYGSFEGIAIPGGLAQRMSASAGDLGKGLRRLAFPCGPVLGVLGRPQARRDPRDFQGCVGAGALAPACDPTVGVGTPAEGVRYGALPELL